jgi:hypothetical protein
MSEVSGVVLARAARRGTVPLDNERIKALNDDKTQGVTRKSSRQARKHPKCFDEAQRAPTAQVHLTVQGSKQRGAFWCGTLRRMLETLRRSLRRLRRRLCRMLEAPRGTL